VRKNSLIASQYELYIFLHGFVIGKKYSFYPINLASRKAILAARPPTSMVWLPLRKGFNPGNFPLKYPNKNRVT
jgi:hypothetical protein